MYVNVFLCVLCVYKYIYAPLFVMFICCVVTTQATCFK